MWKSVWYTRGTLEMIPARGIIIIVDLWVHCNSCFSYFLRWIEVSEFFNTDFGLLCYHAQNTILKAFGKVCNKQGIWSLKTVQPSNCNTCICDVYCNSSAIILALQRNVWLLLSKKVLLCLINSGCILRNFSLGS